MNVLNTILYIIVFILCLSIVVCIHEAGHLLVAKMCKVYCFEYSIGFGPAIFKKKFKHKKQVVMDGKPVFEAKDGKQVPVYEKVEGETQFAIRCVPLGGYVSMAGEDSNQTEDGKIIPKERCLNGVNHFKQICIMLAGITMNFILALVLFFASGLCPYSESVLTSNAITVSADSEASKLDFQTGDKIVWLYQEYKGLTDKTTNAIDEESIFFPSTKEETTINSYQLLPDGSKTSSNSTYDDLAHDCISYALQDVFYTSSLTVNETTGQKAFTLPAEFSNKKVVPTSTRVIHFARQRGDDVKELTATLKAVEVKGSDGIVESYKFDTLGVSPETTTKRLGFVGSIKYSGKTFAQLFTGIYTSLGQLFTPSGWKNVGGIISVYKMSTSGIKSGSVSYFLLLWGYISLNLGCFNLLPFPGLDGWQTLVALFETISRKKFPTKGKAIANTIGLVILMGLAVLLIVKDLIV